MLNNTAAQRALLWLTLVPLALCVMAYSPSGWSQDATPASSDSSSHVTPSLLDLPSSSVKAPPASAIPVLPPAPPPPAVVTPPVPPIGPAAAAQSPLPDHPAAETTKNLAGVIASVSPAPTGTEVKTDEIAPKTLRVKGHPELELLEEPVTIGSYFSLMFTEQDSETIIAPSLRLYDQYTAQVAKAQSGGGGEDLRTLLGSLSSQTEEKQKIKPLPNIYLGSIVYYSPSNWSVWINGKKIVARLNKDTNVLFVSQISRTELTVVWKPNSLQDMGKTWNTAFANNSNRPPNVLVDEASGSVTLTLHPNQTFVPKTLLIHEGLIIQHDSDTSNVAGKNAVAPTSPEGQTQQLMRNPLSFKPH